MIMWVLIMDVIHIIGLIECFVILIVNGETYYLNRQNQKKLQIFYESGLARSFVQCNIICAKDVNCEAISYNILSRECQLSDARSVHGVIVSQDWVIAQKECGPPPQVSHAVVQTDGRYIGVQATYTCTIPSGKVLVSRCQHDETWTVVAKCFEKTIGTYCGSSADCLEPNSLCIENLCVCTYTARYNEETSSCEIECSSYASDYTRYDNVEIFGYYHEVHLAGMSMEACKSRCEGFGTSCGSYEYIPVVGHCVINKFTYQQLLEANPAALHDSMTSSLYTRHC